MSLTVGSGITLEALERALGGDMLALQSLPKADLHAHVLLSAPRPQAEIDLNAALPIPPSRFESLQAFLDHLDAHYWPHYNAPEKLVSMCDSTLRHMVADGVIEAELSFDVLMPTVAGCDWTELAGRLKEVIESYRGRIDVRPELGFARELPRSVWLPGVQAALKTGMFRSIDLYGDEERYPVQVFNDFFELARAHELKVKLHSGEGRNAGRMLEEVRFARPVAVQHGVAAAWDDACMAELVQLGVQLNVCPSSNVALSVVSSYADHPINRLVRAGIRVTIATDDLTIFGSSVTNEYVELYRAGTLTPEELDQVRRNGLSQPR